MLIKISVMSWYFTWWLMTKPPLEPARWLWSPQTLYPGILPDILTYPGILPNMLTYPGILPDMLTYPGSLPSMRTYPGILPGMLIMGDLWSNLYWSPLDGSGGANSRSKQTMSPKGVLLSSISQKLCSKLNCLKITKTQLSYLNFCPAHLWYWTDHVISLVNYLKWKIIPRCIVSQKVAVTWQLKSLQSQKNWSRLKKVFWKNVGFFVKSLMIIDGLPFSYLIEKKRNN